MKPIKLVLSAYGPFPDKTVIDFDKLGSDGVFLISGPTGSGKTTIFDGICYALYGTASGNLRTPKMMRSTYAESDDKTFVELTFSSHDKEYKINRRPEQEIKKINGNGTTVRPAEVSLEILNGGSTVYTGKREVEEKVKEIIGLDANQFRQVTMIAQGEFLKVLNASTEERMEIFRKIFKTGRYTELQEELKIAVKEISSNIIEIENILKREFNNVFTSEQLEKQGLNVDEQSLLYVQKKYILERAYSESNEKVKQNIAIKERLRRDKERLIKESANLEYVLGYFSKLKSISSSLAELEKEKESINQQQNCIPEMKKDIEDIISATSKLEALRPRYQRLEVDSEKISKQRENLKNQEISLISISKEVESIENSLALDRTSLAELEKELNRSDDVNSQLNLRLNFQTSLSNVLDKVTKIEDIVEKFNVFSSKVKESQIDYINLKEEYNNMEVFYLKEQAGMLARELEDGEPCPVCGSTSHPEPAGHADILYEKEDLDAKKKEVESAEEILNRSKQEYSLAKGNLATLEEELSKNIAALEKSYEAQNSSFKKLIEGFGTDSFEMSQENYLNIKNILIEDIKNLKEEQSILAAYKKKSILLKSGISENENKLQKLIIDKNNQNKEYNKLTGEYQASKALYESELKELEYKDLYSLNEQINNYNDKLACKREAVAEIEEKIENYYTEYNELKSGRKTLLSLTKGEHELAVKNNYDRYNIEIDTLKNRINSVEIEQTEILSHLKNISKALEVYEKSIPELNEKKDLYDMYSNLSATCSGELPGKTKIKLETFVQMSFLDRILSRANIRFLKMSEGRYMLTRDEKGDNKRSQTGLDLRVHDLSNNTYRSTKSLSGGESFQASLCLALGLADEIQYSAGGIQIETMFIDEGFGTLDNVALKNAVDSLVDLSKGNKLVGIISHVDELRERIDKGIIIEKSSISGSKLTIQS